MGAGLAQQSPRLAVESLDGVYFLLAHVKALSSLLRYFQRRENFKRPVPANYRSGLDDGLFNGCPDFNEFLVTVVLPKGLIF